MAVLLVALYALVAISPLLVVAALWMKGEMTLMHETGTSAAFAAYAIMALALLLTHPPLMAYGGAGLGLLYDIKQPWYVYAGRILLLVLLAHAFLSVFGQYLGLTFERWRRGHNVLAVIILAGMFIHSLGAGYDLGPTPIRVLWLALLGMTTFAYVHHKFLVPKRLLKIPYQVVGVEQETHNVWTIKLAAPKGERIYDYQPGQFHFITFQRSGGLPVEEHHWTISSSPANKDFISSTIKESGDFTATIGKTRVGDTAVVEGPFGRFGYTFYPFDEYASAHERYEKGSQRSVAICKQDGRGYSVQI
jgi:predicted ferric reductase